MGISGSWEEGAGGRARGSRRARLTNSKLNSIELIGKTSGPFV